MKSIKGSNGLDKNMVMWPFKRNKRQKIYSLIALIIGLFLMSFSIPFYFQIGSYAIASGAFGMGLFILSGIYFLDATL